MRELYGKNALITTTSISNSTSKSSYQPCTTKEINQLIDRIEIDKYYMGRTELRKSVVILKDILFRIEKIEKNNRNKGKKKDLKENMTREEERRKHKWWCSKHQVVHGKNVRYKSCNFPNRKHGKKCTCRKCMEKKYRKIF